METSVRDDSAGVSGCVNASGKYETNQMSHARNIGITIADVTMNTSLRLASRGYFRIASIVSNTFTPKGRLHRPLQRVPSVSK